MDDGPLFFYTKRSEYGEFSNFWPFAVRMDGKVWPTNEHWYQAMKSTDPEVQESIRRLQRPWQAKQAGGEVKLRKGWDDMKYDLMVRVVYAKFDQSPLLRGILLGTGKRALHEDCKDRWWGGGPNFPKGRDWLGKILMQVRFRLREKYGDDPTDGLDEIIAGLE